MAALHLLTLDIVNAETNTHIPPGTQEVDRKKVLELERQRQWQQRHKLARIQGEASGAPGAASGQPGMGATRPNLDRQSTRVFSPDEFSTLNLPLSHMQLPEVDPFRDSRRGSVAPSSEPRAQPPARLRISGSSESSSDSNRGNGNGNVNGSGSASGAAPTSSVGSRSVAGSSNQLLQPGPDASSLKRSLMKSRGSMGFSFDASAIIRERVEETLAAAAAASKASTTSLAQSSSSSTLPRSVASPTPQVVLIPPQAGSELQPPHHVARRASVAVVPLHVPVERDESPSSDYAGDSHSQPNSLLFDTQNLAF